MTLSIKNNTNIVIRKLQYRDLEAIATLVSNYSKSSPDNSIVGFTQFLQKLQRWYGLSCFVKLLRNAVGYDFCIYLAQNLDLICGLIQVSPFNISRTTWRVEWVLVDPILAQGDPNLLTNKKDIGSLLLRHCFETIWEARTWILEVDINDKNILALYRQNGFQPLAQMTYWLLSEEKLQELATVESELPNILPVSNADASLLYQLDTVSMPPLLRQVFDRHIQDFKTNFFSGLINQFKYWLENIEVKSGYIFEPQRKAAIGYFKLQCSKDGSSTHQAELTVHPAYTWLYPKILTQMAQIIQRYPNASLKLASADYQPEREEYLEKLGATRSQHTLLMSRSVWHKLRESKPLDALQLSGMLKGLQPVRTPIPTRISWLQYMSDNQDRSSKNNDTKISQSPSNFNHKSNDVNSSGKLSDSSNDPE